MESLPIVLVAVVALAIGAVVGGVRAERRTTEAIRRVALGGERGAPTVGEEPLAETVRRSRQRAEAAERGLADRDADAAYLVELVAVGMVRLSDGLVVEVANAAAHVYLGRPPGAMLGRTAIEALGDHRLETIAREAREHGAASGEVALREPDGPVLVARARRSPVLGIWLVLEDVAELRRLQRIRAEFVDNLSHELRTPITTIGLLAETLARDIDAAGDQLPAKVRERVAKLENETVTIGQMVGELLDLARIEGGGAQLLLDDVDLGRVAIEATERLRPFAERQGVELRVLVPGAIPPVRGEAARLAQVVSNLVHNAVKFSPTGSVVEIAVAVEDDRVVTRISDRGIGIAAGDLPRIFERFFKADRSRTRGGGTGLGLAIARHIVEGHNGTIAADSIEGDGSTFTFAIPVADGPRA